MRARAHNSKMPGVVFLIVVPTANFEYELLNSKFISSRVFVYFSFSFLFAHLPSVVAFLSSFVLAGLNFANGNRHTKKYYYVLHVMHR